MPPTSADKLRIARRWRLGMLVAAFVVPSVLGLLFARQARRLEALADHGEVIYATVTSVSRVNDSVKYAYVVNGVEYAWETRVAQAPDRVGATFQVIHIPETPSFSRATTDRAVVRRELEEQRGFTWKACAGISIFFLLFAGLAHRDVLRAQANAPSELDDPAAYAKRIKIMGGIMIVLVALMGSCHVIDARQRGQSIVPAILGAVLAGGIVVATLYFGARNGPAKAQERSAKIMRWVLPGMLAIAVLNFLLTMLVSR